MKLDSVFNPRSVAIIGASRTPGKVGNIITTNIIESGYKGEIYPINPNSNEILGLKCYPSIIDVSGAVDIAVLAIPARYVVDVAEECGIKGVKVLVVISAGFRETGHEGALLERKLVDVGKRYDMRIQGPNCLGLINTASSLNLTFAHAMPKKGSIGFISQSGALITAVLDWVIQEDIGFHSFISLGNKADLNEVDFIEAMSKDDNVKVILLYLESIEEGRRFIEVASKAVRKKPVIILKGGTSTAGVRAAGSHTGALVGSIVAYETAFDKAGVIMAEGVEELFNYSLAFSEQSLPRGEGMVIITNAGGPGILATDLSEKLGVKITNLEADVRNRLIKGLPIASSVGNPIDVLGDAKADRYRFVLEEVLKEQSINSMLVLLTPQAMTESLATAEAIVDMAKKFPRKPILAVFMGGKRVDEAAEYLKKNGVPCYGFPEKAIKTISAMYQYARFMKEPDHFPVRFRDIDIEKVKSIFSTVREENRVVLLSHEASEVVEAYGIRSTMNLLASTPDEAVKYADELGYPVVMKVSSPDILHKTDIGGIVLNITSSEEVRSSFHNIMSSVTRFIPNARIYGLTLYKMIPQGNEIIIGMSQDIQFGPLVMFGLGGIYVNFLKDVSFRLAPLSEHEAQLMMEETRAFSLLKGIRGEEPSDTESLKNMLLRVGQLVWDFPEIVEMDINPVIVYRLGDGCIALDVKITLSKD
jgi:acetyltransferase